MDDRRSGEHDDQTLAFYEKEAEAYAGHARAAHPDLQAFLDRLAPGACILELGCGGGADAEVMLRRGFDVTVSDGSPALAAQARRRLGRPVRVMLFEELDEEERFDAVWASACLVHVPEQALGGVLSRIWRALRPGGLFFASFKAGRGGGRDSLGRYFNFPSREALEQAYRLAGPWAGLSIHEASGGGYDGVSRTWFGCFASKPCA